MSQVQDERQGARHIALQRGFNHKDNTRLAPMQFHVSLSLLISIGASHSAEDPIHRIHLCVTYLSIVKHFFHNDQFLNPFYLYLMLIKILFLNYWGKNENENVSS